MVEYRCFSPHLCVGFLFLILYPAASPASLARLAHTPLCHTPSFTHNFYHTPSLTHQPSFTHNFVTHHLWHTIFHTPLCPTPSLTHHLSHTTLSPTIFDTPSFTHNFITHHLWHTTLSHTIFHTHTTLSTPSFIHNFITHHHWHTIFHTPSLTHRLWHTTLSHTIFHTPLCHTPSFTHNSITHHLWHTTLSSTCVWRGRRGTWFTFCVASVALGDVYLRLAWQARHL